jgi:hypothetical protein
MAPTRAIAHLDTRIAKMERERIGEMSRWQADDVVGCGPRLERKHRFDSLRHERRSRIALEDNVSVLRDGSDNVYDRHAAG